MRVMVMMKSDCTSEASEATAAPTQEYREAMARYTEELVKAGVVLGGERLHSSDKGARVHYEGGRTSVVDGPFTESKELVAGFWLWQVSSMEEGIEWLRRFPVPDGSPVEIEIRQVVDMEDVAD